MEHQKYRVNLWCGPEIYIFYRHQRWIPATCDSMGPIFTSLIWTGEGYMYSAAQCAWDLLVWSVLVLIPMFCAGRPMERRGRVCPAWPLPARRHLHQHRHRRRLRVPQPRLPRRLLRKRSVHGPSLTSMFDTAHDQAVVPQLRSACA